MAFDLDGSALPQRWTSIRPTAAWLVFDKHGRGSITSGLQLFGSVTFWLFWRQGYDALRSLDDNDDEQIADTELKGLALWHDRNVDGRSDPGEVRPVGDWGIVSLSCEYQHDTGHPDEIAMSPRGVTFGDGTTRPTFDLILPRRHDSESRRNDFRARASYLPGSGRGDVRMPPRFRRRPRFDVFGVTAALVACVILAPLPLESEQAPPDRSANPLERIAINDNRMAAGTPNAGILAIDPDVRRGMWHPDRDSDPGTR